MSANTLELNVANFENSVLRSPRPVLVDFWAEWCQPCRMIGPTIDKLAGQFTGEVSVGKVNIDDNAPLAVTYDVRSIPTILLFKDGRVVKRFVGLQSEQTLSAAIQEVLQAQAA